MNRKKATRRRIQTSRQRSNASKTQKLRAYNSQPRVSKGKSSPGILSRFRKAS